MYESSFSRVCTVIALAGLVACADTEVTEPASDPKVSTEEAPALQAEAAPTAPVCSGKSGRLRGKSRQTLRAGGLSRSFVYYAPENLDPNQPAPLLIVPHGYTMSGQQMYDITRYAELADREGFVAVFPDGAAGAGPWNVGSNICGNGAFVRGNNNDQAFVDAMIEFAAQDRCIDREHVFMAGFSMGGYFSHESACRNPKVKGVADHSGGTHNLSSCLKRPVPVLIMHYQPDNLIAYRCGVDARDKWVQRNGCSPTNPRVETEVNGRCEYYEGCVEGGQVAFCTFTEPSGGMGELLLGHGWAGGYNKATGGNFAIPGPTSATEISWDFFKRYAW